MKTSALTLAAALALTSGCAAFKANDLPTLDSSSYAVQNQQPVKVFSTWQAREGGNLHKTYFNAALRGAGCCEIVETAEQADLVVTGVSVDESNPGANLFAALSGFTFGVIPAWATLHVHLRVTATESEQQHKYDLADKATMVIWLPMLLAMPFTGNPLDVEQEVHHNTYRNLVARMKNDGLLNN